VLPLSSSVTVTVPPTALGVGRGDGDGCGELRWPGPLDAVPAYAAVGFGSSGAVVSGVKTASSLGEAVAEARFAAGCGLGEPPALSSWSPLPPPQAAADTIASATHASLMAV
jgi:hypothetical protein